jgi:predicted Holliday junction resolvase-like endonuclease
MDLEQPTRRSRRRFTPFQVWIARGVREAFPELMEDRTPEAEQKITEWLVERMKERRMRTTHMQMHIDVVMGMVYSQNAPTPP